jgi:hypothetical protein
MSKARLFSTAAAILLIGGGAAMAQGQSPNGKDNPGRAPAAQQNAPAEKMGPTIHQGQRKAPETTGQATDRVESGHDVNVQKHPSNMDRKKAPETTGQKSEEHGRTEERHDASPKGGAQNEGNDRQRGEHNAQQRDEHRDRAGAGNSEHNRATTGQGAAGAAHLSHEQRTRITTIFHRHRDHRIDAARLNISIRVGARVPSSVHFYPLPVEVVEIYPEWRGYDYVYVGDEILILDPGTHEIVAILEA